MATRRKAPLEQRLREHAKKHIPVMFGDQKTFAKRLGRPESWVTTYLEGKSHPDLDTTVAIARLLELSPDLVTRMDPLPDADPLTRQLLEYWAAIDAKHRPGLLGMLRPFVDTVAPGAIVRHIPQPRAGAPRAKTRTHQKKHVAGG